jgi:hypothetical protein
MLRRKSLRFPRERELGTLPLPVALHLHYHKGRRSDTMADVQPHPGDEESCEACDPRERKQGPVREAGGTTGAGNPSAAQSSRTGGATSGTGSGDPYDPDPMNPKAIQNQKRESDDV